MVGERNPCHVSVGLDASLVDLVAGHYLENMELLWNNIIFPPRFHGFGLDIDHELDCHV